VTSKALLMAGHQKAYKLLIINLFNN
jgi:hypothetical protein